MDLFNQTALKCSKLITECYSTSFTLGIKTLDRKFHFPIYAIYGFVRYADEIVDTFYDYDQAYLLRKFKADAYESLESGISLNPILQSFQHVVRQYHIERELIDSFLKSMEMDLYHNQYNAHGYETYIYGSAEVVGLMCLRVFCEGDEDMYQRLKASACKLGSAFQKVNFLRDIKSDYVDRGRIYFPGVDFDNFGKGTKQLIEEDIERDFNEAHTGILNLPRGARMGVHLAYLYYRTLFNKIKAVPTSRIQQVRVRVPDAQKIALLAQTYIRFRLKAWG